MEEHHVSLASRCHSFVCAPEFIATPPPHVRRIDAFKTFLGPRDNVWSRLVRIGEIEKIAGPSQAIRRQFLQIWKPLGGAENQLNLWISSLVSPRQSATSAVPKSRPNCRIVDSCASRAKGELKQQSTRSRLMQAPKESGVHCEPTNRQFLASSCAAAATSFSSTNGAGSAGMVSLAEVA